MVSVFPSFSSSFQTFSLSFLFPRMRALKGRIWNFLHILSRVVVTEPFYPSWKLFGKLSLYKPIMKLTVGSSGKERSEELRWLLL